MNFRYLVMMGLVLSGGVANANSGFGEVPKEFHGPKYNCAFASGDELLKKEPFDFGLDKDSEYNFIQVRHPESGKPVETYGKASPRACPFRAGEHCSWGFSKLPGTEQWFLYYRDAARLGSSPVRILIDHYEHGADGYIDPKTRKTDIYCCIKSEE